MDALFFLLPGGKPSVHDRQGGGYAEML